MKRYSKDKNINQKVRDLIKSGWEAKLTTTGIHHPALRVKH